jgi:hypothetical protein
MSRKPSRRARSEILLRAFLKASKSHAKRVRRQVLREKRNLRIAASAGHESSSESVASSMSLGLSVTLSDPNSYSDGSSTTSSEGSSSSQSRSGSQTSEELEDVLTLMEIDEALESDPADVLHSLRRAS